MIALLLATFVLIGHVSDQTTGQPLAGVTVRAGNAHAKTDASGTFTLRTQRGGKLSVILESDDVPPQNFDVTLSSAKTRRNFTACSTTLDYSCQPQLPVPAAGS